jgi:hypothetical protein
MHNRVHLMHLIAQLDIELSKSGRALPPRRRNSILARCTRIHDDAGRDDEHLVGQALHWLLHKHRLQPEATPGPTASL